MNKRWLGRAIVSNQRKKSDLLLEKRSKYGNWNGSIRYTYNCIFFFLLFPPFCFFCPPFLLLSLFLPQFRWIFIATVTIDLVEEFLLLHLIWTLTGNDSIVWHERSLIAIALPCYADLIRPFFSPDANEDGLGTNRAIYLADASHLNFLDYYLISWRTECTLKPNPFVKIHLYNTSKKKPTSKLEYLSIVFFNLNHPKRRKKSMSWKMLFVSCRYLDSFSRYKLLKIKNIHWSRDRRDLLLFLEISGK